MAVAVGEKVNSPVPSIKEKCVKCMKGVSFVKTLLIMTCTGLAFRQISSSVQKLIKKPINTYTHFDFNRTIMYPSVTFCREPPYKHDKLEEYDLYSHPRFTSTWREFNFSRIGLDELWEDITYDDQDFFVQYGLDEYTENENKLEKRHSSITPGFNVAVMGHCIRQRKDKEVQLVKIVSQDVNLKPTMGFINGRCYTLEPKVTNDRASKASGFSVTLQHTADDVATSTSILPPGYHVYVHYSREPYTEVEVYNGGLVDYLYVNVGETLDVKLTVNEYQMISREHDPCTDRMNYSANGCKTKYVWSEVGRRVGCSGPWMISDLPRCSNFSDMRDLITTYINLYQNHGCPECPRFCRSYLYNAFVTDRQRNLFWDDITNKWREKTGNAALQTQLFIHFNSMMVSVYEERYNYDWNIFLSDIGGSIGFLLGLSVIGFIKLLDSLWRHFFKLIFVRKKTVPEEAIPDVKIEAEWKNKTLIQ